MKWTVGPLPPAVYWRRRAVVAVPLLLIAVISSCMVSGPDSGDGTATLTVGNTPQQPSPSSASESPSPSLTPSETIPPSTPVPTITVVPSPPASVAVAAPVAPAAPPPPGPCADTDLSVVAVPASPKYRVGQHPRLILVVTNASPRACYRDLGASQQELRVFWNATRVWSSDDCAAGTGTDRRLLQPGEKRTYFQTWNGRRSKPGCAGPRDAVGPGSYRVVGRFGTAWSRPASFVLAR